MATKTTTTPIDDEGARSFSTLIATLGEGTLHAELSEELREAVKRLEAHAIDFGKAKGVLTLKLNINVDREGAIVVIHPEVAVKLPKPARKAGLFWINKAGNLVSENPKQKQLELRAVPATATAAAPAETQDAPRAV